MDGQVNARHPAWQEVPASDWDDWRWQLRHRVTRLDTLEGLLELTEAEREGIRASREGFGFAVTPYYLSLMGGPACPVRRQAIPHVHETRRVDADMADPLAEEEHSPVPMLSHRYPDRALLYATHTCPVYCRHCTRQRKVGDAIVFSDLAGPIVVGITAIRQPRTRSFCRLARMPRAQAVEL